MATPIEALQNRASTLQNALGSSSTAYAPDTPPSKRDISTSSQLDSVNKQIDDLRSTQLRNQWYGPTTTKNPNDVPAEGDAPADGWLMGGFKALQRPLNAIVGAGQYALGKGTESSLAGNINQAMKTGLTSGDVLRQMGAPRAVQMPLGFALDVMLDPVNWLTAGSSALIPRVGKGLIMGGLGKAAVEGGADVAESGVRGALKAAGTGLTSNLEKKAATVMNAIPFAKNIPKYSDLAENIGQKAVAGAEKYDALTGSSVYDRLGKGIFNQPSGLLGNAVENTIKKIPSVDILGHATPSGEQISDFFKYSTRTPTEIADLKDQVLNLGREKGMILVRNGDKAEFQSVDDLLKPGSPVTLPGATKSLTDNAIQDADTVFHPANSVGQVTVADTFDNAQKLLESAGQDYNLKHLTAAYKVNAPGTTGVQWYDDIINKLKSTTVNDILHAHLGSGETAANDIAATAGDVGGSALEKAKADAVGLIKNWNSYDTYRDLRPFAKMLDAQKGLLSVFKSAKVPMNLGSHVVAHIGNFFMGAMMGLPVANPDYVSAIARGSMLVKGRLGAKGLRDVFFNDLNSWVDFLDKNPSRFRQLTGMDPRDIIGPKGKIQSEEKVMGVLGTNVSELKSFLSKAWDDVESGITSMLGSKESLEDIAQRGVQWEQNASPLEKAAMKKGIGKYKSASETLAEMAKEAPIRQSEMPGTWAVSETPATQAMDKLKNYVADQAAAHPYNPAVRAANTLLNSMPRWYEHIDQSFKIGTTDFLSRIGLTEQQLAIVSRTIPITPSDILDPIVKNGQKMYRLTPLKASEVATESFMNYAGMPDFVKVMRALPIAGSPFLSFAYAMAIKTGKTAINNPAIFNKVGFLLNEISGARSPEEKVALEQKYNQYLKSPTVVKIFGMWNTDVKNLVPWYQMNMLNPSEKTYDNSTQSQILKMTDNIPIFQDPIGQVIKNYFIQPWVLSGSGQAPQGQFGEPLYPAFDEKGKPIDVSNKTKAFYALRSVAEGFTPGVAGYAGLVNFPMGLSPETIEYVPSYGARNLANATQGRSSVGAMTKENAIQKTLRSILGRTGIPVYTLDPTKSSSKKP